MNKSDVFSIKDPNIASYLGGLIVVNDKYLIMRSAEEKDFAKEGYYFPGCKANASLANAKQLKEQLFLKYRLKVVVGRKIGDVVIKNGVQKYASLELYLCMLAGKTSMNTAGIIPSLVTSLEMQKFVFSKADGYLAQRVIIFDKVYRGIKRVTPLSESEKKESLLLYKSLLDHKKRVFSSDINDFALLLQSESTFEEIINAYTWISKRANISFERYLKVAKNLEKNEGKKL